MRTVQEVFDIAITTNAYKNVYGHREMCWVLQVLCERGQITHLEYVRNKKEINKYLGVQTFLILALANADLPYSFEDRLKIYQNWESRPPLRWTQKLLFKLGIK